MLLSKKRPRVLKSPKVGLLRLSTSSPVDLAETDVAWLSGLFASVVVTGAAIPRCDVLFIYGDIAVNGRLTGSVLGLREIVRDSGASIVVVASENPPENYIKAGAQRSFGRANLVMTLDRCGGAFESFFQALFSKMWAGASMTDAWMQLNPKPPRRNFDAPETIFSCEVGPLTFA
jgi:hypothetical protein